VGWAVTIASKFFVVEKRVTPSGVTEYEHELCSTKEEAEKMLNDLETKALNLFPGYSSSFWLEEIA
jgi:hypothetical protein